MTPSHYDVVIVTEGSSRTGREVVRALARRGFAVVVVYLGAGAGAEAAVDEVLAAHGTALAVRADPTAALDVERLFTETAAVFGGVDVVVHAAPPAGPVVDGQAPRWLRRGGVIVGPAGPAARDSAIDGGADEAADLLAIVDRWRRARPSAVPAPTREPPGPG